MSWNKENLKKAFEKAGLTLEFAKQSFAGGRSGMDVFGLDIRRKDPKKAHTEYFLMWPGHEKNTITIRDSDKHFGQVILTIAENEREFEQTVDSYTVRAVLFRYKGDNAAALNDLLGTVRAGYPRVKTWSHKIDKLVVVHKTPKAARSFLLGMDERQLFMTPVDRSIHTVKAAHASLKSPSVTFFEGKASGKTIRQGEWFFVNLPKGELGTLESFLKRSLTSVLKKTPIGKFAGRPGGKPHTADELVVANLQFEAPDEKGKTRSGFVEHTVLKEIVRVHGATDAGLADMLRSNNITKNEVVRWDPDNFVLIVRLPLKGRVMRNAPRQGHRNEIYVRGSVRHLDHKTVKFSTWRKVIANTEAERGGGSAAATGGTWID